MTGQFKLHRVGGVMLLILAAGCSSPSLRESFDPVQRSVKSAVGQEATWHRVAHAGHLEHDTELKESVSMMLTDLTPQRAVQIALLRNAHLQAMYEELGIARADLVQAGLLRNPVFDLAVKLPVDGGPVDLEMSVVQDFLDVLLIPLRRRIAGHALEVTRLQVTREALDLLARTRAAYLTVQAATQRLDLARDHAHAAAVSLEAMQRIHRAGNVPDLGLLQQQQAFAQAKLELQLAEEELASTREGLNQAMGLWGDDAEGWRITQPLPLPPAELSAGTLESLEEQAVAASLELRSLREQTSALEAQQRVLKNTAWLPELGLGAAGEREEGSWTVGPAFALGIPIFDRGQARLAASQALLSRGRQRAAAEAVDLRSQARLTRRQLIAAHRRWSFHQQQVVPLSEQVLQQTLLQYNAMQRGVFQLLQARQRLTDAQRAAIDHTLNYWLTELQVEQLRRGTLPPRMAMPMNGSRPMSLETSRTEGGH